jgi:hypothetical protein
MWLVFLYIDMPIGLGGNGASNKQSGTKKSKTSNGTKTPPHRYWPDNLARLANLENNQGSVNSASSFISLPDQVIKQTFFF